MKTDNDSEIKPNLLDSVVGSLVSSHNTIRTCLISIKWSSLLLLVFMALSVVDKLITLYFSFSQ